MVSEDEVRNRRALHRARWRADWDGWNRLMAERDRHGWQLYPWMREVDSGFRRLIELLNEEN